MSKLFIVDDDHLTCELHKTIALPIFDEVAIFYSGKNFIKETINKNDVVLLDLMMPDLDGVEIIRFLANSNICVQLILISGADHSVLNSVERLAQGYGLTVSGCLSKPIAIDKLSVLLHNVVPKPPAKLTVAQVKHYAKVQSSASKQTFPLANSSQGFPHKIDDQEVEKSKPSSFIPNHQDILEGISAKQFILYYQPQVAISTNELCGVEALVRWQHPEMGLIFPDSFISIAEQTGAIEQLTSNIVNMAVKQSAIWQKEGFSITVSINLSAQNINDLSFPEQLSQLIQYYSVDPSMLILEVTESALMGNLITSLDILTRMRLKGFQLSIDDFGTGFSSLSQLHKIPFTELKIDQSFVNRMLQDGDCEAIVETCIMLGHKLGMKIVAEGIENGQTLTLLQRLKCDMAQGYFFSKPIAAENVLKWQKTLTGKYYD